ncbi:MAG: acetoin utilization protein AcuC, partial [Fimbriimonadaceae bacterium]
MSDHHLYFAENLLDYSFPSPHPFNSERLREAMQVLSDWGFSWESPDPGDETILLLVHDADYLDHLKRMSAGEVPLFEESWRFGIGTGDTPAFPGIFEAALATVGASVSCANRIVEGQSVAISLAGGLHHAQRGNASGFCAVNDIAVAIMALLKKFDRVAYIDIDLHHGDGVEAIFRDDPRVMTASIHEFGPGFYPGTGDVNFGNTVNAPMARGTNGPLWLKVFTEGVLQKVKEFNPDVIVLQMGVDPHTYDPLGHLNVSGRYWLEAVRAIKALDTPILALGGGGYDRRNPPRPASGP